MLKQMYKHVKISYENDKKHTIGLVACRAVIIACVPLLTLVSANVINVVSSKMAFVDMLIAISALVMVIGLKYVAESLYNANKDYLLISNTAREQVKMAEKSLKLPYEVFEQEDFLNLLKLVKDDVGEKVTEGLCLCLSVLEYAGQILSIVIMIVVHEWWVAIAVAAILSILIVVAKKSGEINYSAFEDAEEERRKAELMSEALTKKESVYERKLFNYNDFFYKKWEKHYENANKIETEAEKMTFIKTGGISLETSFLSLMIAGVLVFPVIHGKMSIGMYAALVAAGFRLVDQMSWGLFMLIQDIIKSNLYIKDYFKYYSLEEKPAENKVMIDENIESIVFDDVSFTYPNSEKPVLKHLSFSLKKGKRYMIIGVNGAGKTTIVNLLSGLYNSYEGRILINGTELKSISDESRRKLLSIVFQDFNHYNISIREYLIDGDEVLIEKKLRQVLKKVGLSEKINSLPQGINSNIGKIFENGIDFSGGEWQKLALAKSLLSKASVKIFDEPTAAIDPVNERKIFDIFENEVNDPDIISIIISHRLGCVEQTDEILVLSDGIITEKGTARELLEKDGLYNEMYTVQKEWYYELQEC